MYQGTGIALAAKGAVNEGRRLELLLRMAPDVKSVYVPHNPDDPVTITKPAAVRDAARRLSTTPRSMSAKPSASNRLSTVNGGRGFQ